MKLIRKNHLVSKNFIGYTNDLLPLFLAAKCYTERSWNTHCNPWNMRLLST